MKLQLIRSARHWIEANQRLQVLAREKNALLILDDGDGRRIARSLELKITGTIGLLLLAAEDGKLNLKRSIDDLMSAGFRLSKKEYGKIVSGAMGG